MLTPGAKHRKKPQPLNCAPGGQERHPHRAGIATLPGRQSSSESDPESATKPTPIRARISGSSPPGIGTGSASADGKAAPHLGAARERS